MADMAGDCDCLLSPVDRNKTKESGKENNSRKKGRKNQNPRFCRDTTAQTNNRDNWDEVMCDKVAFL